MIDHTRLSELRTHEFSKSLRGYSPQEVDDFLHTLFDEMSEVLDKMASLATRVEDLEEEEE